MKHFLKIISATLTALLILTLQAAAFEKEPLPYSGEEYKYAEALGSLIQVLFSPEKITVTLKGKSAWIETDKLTYKDLKIEKLIFLANFKEDVKKALDVVKAEEILDKINVAEGEVIFTEEDINNFLKTKNFKNFTEMKLALTPNGFVAKSEYKSDFTLGKTLNLVATGKFKSKEDGLYLDNADLYIQDSKQPPMLSDLILRQLNPILKYDELPFKLILNKVKNANHRITITSEPARILSGSTWKSK